MLNVQWLAVNVVNIIILSVDLALLSPASGHLPAPRVGAPFTVQRAPVRPISTSQPQASHPGSRSWLLTGLSASTPVLALSPPPHPLLRAPQKQRVLTAKNVLGLH